MDLVTLGLIVLVALAWRKRWRGIGFAVAVLAVIYGLSIQEWVQRLVTVHMSPVVRQQVEDAKDIKALRDDLQQLDQRLTQQQTALEAQATHLNTQETTLTTEQDALETVRADLQQAQQRIEAHHEQLAGVGSLVKDLIGGVHTEELSVKQYPGRVVITSKGKDLSAVYLKLSYVPRSGSLQIQWDGNALPTGSIQVHRNILAMTVAQDAKKLAKQPFAVHYLPDTALPGEALSLSVRAGEVYVGDQRVSDILAGEPAGG